MLVSFHVPRCHGIDTITGVVQAYVFYLIGWIKREDCQQKKQQENKTDQIRRFNFPHPHVYSTTKLTQCQGKN